LIGLVPFQVRSLLSNVCSEDGAEWRPDTQTSFAVMRCASRQPAANAASDLGVGFSALNTWVQQRADADVRATSRRRDAKCPPSQRRPAVARGEGRAKNGDIILNAHIAESCRLSDGIHVILQGAERRNGFRLTGLASLSFAAFARRDSLHRGSRCGYWQGWSRWLLAH
jgi:hypothetical protein